MHCFDAQEIGSKELYKLIIGTIVPRPIAFVSTVSGHGIGNLAPFSFFNGVSSNPPAVMLAITRKSDGTKKDTLINIETTKQLVINSVDESLVKAMNACSADYPYGVDEMLKVGLSSIPSVKVRPPRVAESPIHLECELYDTLEVGGGGEGSSTIVVAKIVMMHVRADLMKDGKIVIDRFKPVARLGGIGYAKVTETFDLPRPILDASNSSNQRLVEKVGYVSF